MKHTSVLFFLGLVINLYLCASDYSLDVQENFSKNTHKLRCSPPQIHGGKVESSFKTKSREYAHSRFPYPSFLEREDSGLGQEIIPETFMCVWCGQIYQQELFLAHNAECKQPMINALKEAEKNGSIRLRRSYDSASALRQQDETTMEL